MSEATDPRASQNLAGHGSRPLSSTSSSVSADQNLSVMPGTLNDESTARTPSSARFTQDPWDGDAGHENPHIPSPDDFAAGTIPTRLSNLPVSLAASRAREKETALDDDYQLRPQDVICLPRGSQESTSSQPGNERFRVLINLCRPRYQRATTSQEKALIGREIVDAVREFGGKFIRKQDGIWYDVGGRKAREKVRHALRAAVSRMESSATASPETPHRSSFSSAASSGTFSSFAEQKGSGDNCSDSEGSLSRSYGSPIREQDILPEPISSGTIHRPPQEPEGFRDFMRSTFLAPDEQGRSDDDVLPSIFAGHKQKKSEDR